ncbi:hypothetical protein [Microbacterium sp. NPDC058389]|uniref:hypothetical protein n=1 Tax=Microbacterium sp. NPDC058389 TaxID=3346475 RepID=UPI00364F262D
MKLADAWRMMLRRWYIVVPGLLLAVACGVAAWMAVEPEYERQGVQIVLPGMGSLPEDATNPYLYLSGLALPADIVVQAVMGENVLSEVLADFPGAEVEVSRSGTSAPIITIKVTAGSDADAEALLAIMMDRTVSTLESMQQEESIAGDSRMSITTLAVDTQSRQIERTRLLIAGGAALLVAAIALFVTALVDGLAKRRRRRAGAPVTADERGAPDDPGRGAAAGDDPDRDDPDLDGPDAGRPGAAGHDADLDALDELDAQLEQPASGSPAASEHRPGASGG